MSSKCETPPSSDIEQPPHLPPSPPLSPKPSAASIAPLDRLIAILRLCRSGRYPFHPLQGNWQTFPLDCNFEVLLDRIEKEGLLGYFDDKVHYDYDEVGCTLRMPSATHERFIEHVVSRISTDIDKLAERLGEDRQNEIAKALRGIERGGSTTLELHAPRLENSSQESDAAEKVVRRSPDASYYGDIGEGGNLPALVVEVSYAQQKKDLPRLAESYIIDSEHAIRCVLGLDITYSNAKGKAPKDHTGTISVWRPDIEYSADGEEIGVCACDVHEMPFRGSQGITCEGEVQLTLSDLLPRATMERLPATAYDEHITIPFADLSAFLYNAERVQTAKYPERNASLPTKFRKRKRSPSEELSDGRESSFLMLEEAELENEQKVDRDWRQPRQRVKTEPLAATPTEIVERRRSKRKASGGRSPPMAVICMLAMLSTLGRASAMAGITPCNPKLPRDARLSALPDSDLA
ncbi:hypothetical protein AC579_9099 [Pseudocercospora musae]|uniref:Uncharacterized protein n=1 Tax=Pseudocercospora musae TaxID=113226 RepID=A0A139IIP5_9PEZI|nr:hypothetical protein AC579_9099 [Pseudocercospora musae]